MLKVIVALQTALIEAKEKEDGGYTLEALLIGAVGVAIVLALAAPVRELFQTAIDAVAAWIAGGSVP
jgi:hypothetical protein